MAINAGSIGNVFIRATRPPQTWIVPRSPTPYDTQGYALLDQWLNTVNDEAFILVSLKGNSMSRGEIAVWLSLSGNGTVIEVLGGNNITITGDPNVSPVVNVSGTTNHSVLLGNTTGSINSLANGTTGQILTAQTGADPIWSSSGGFAQSFPTDSGTATPIAGVLNIKAGTATLNAGSTVEFEATTNTVQLNVTDANNTTIIGKSSGNLTLTGANNSVYGALSAPALTSSPGNSIFGEGSATLLAGGTGLNTIIGRTAATSIVTGTGNFIAGAGGGSAFTLADSNSVVINGAGQAGRSGLLQISLPTYGTVIHNYPGFASSVNGENYFFGVGAGNFTMNPAGTVGNIGIGGGALSALVSGVGGNIAIGDVGMAHLTTGVQNTGVGKDCFVDAGGGTGLISGSFNIGLGFTAGSAYTGAESSNILIGNNGLTGESNTLRIGNGTGVLANQLIRAFIHGIRGQTTGVADAVAVLIDSAGQLGTVSSSARYKENINDMGSYSDVLRKLRPVTFKYKSHPVGAKSVGLIAEEVAKIAPDLVIYDKEGLPETVRYDDINRMLLNEFQKHCQLIAELQAINADLLNRIRMLEERLMVN